MDSRNMITWYIYKIDLNYRMIETKNLLALGIFRADSLHIIDILLL